VPDEHPAPLQPAGAEVVVVMGVSGSGKSTVASLLAGRLGCELADADDFHPPSNVAKMAAGLPLDDQDRAPWLRDIAAWMAVRARSGRSAVASCSALKRAYRDVLRAASPRLVFLHLTGPRELLERRMRDRTGHFMPASLLDSQLASLEPLAPDERGLTLDATDAPEVIVAAALASWPPAAAGSGRAQGGWSP
jgi:gluconokinase